MTGRAFIYQPTFGDNSAARNRESAQQQGNWWIGELRIDPARAFLREDSTQTVVTLPVELSLPLGFVSLAKISHFSLVGVVM